jgi:hypothetical protein
LGGVESRQSPGRVDDVVSNQDQRFEVRDRGGVGVGVGVGEVTKMSKLCEGSRESDQVVDSIFELKIIHAREVTYKQSRTIGG